MLKARSLAALDIGILTNASSTFAKMANLNTLDHPTLRRRVNLAWRALSWCRRTSVRPPDHEIEKSVIHRLNCAMPLRDICLISRDAGHLMKMRDCPSECGTVDTYVRVILSIANLDTSSIHIQITTQL